MKKDIIEIFSNPASKISYVLSILFIFFLVANGSAQLLEQNEIAVEKIADGFQFTEGPCWRSAGYLVFSDISGNSVYKWSPSAGTEIYLSPSGKTNGIAEDIEGRLILAQHGNRRIIRLEEDGAEIPLATHYNSKRLNSPDDLVIKSDGAIYFTDPPYGINNSQEELGFYGVYRIEPETNNLTLLIDHLLLPNGIEFSRDEKTLYICDSHSAKVMAYSVEDDGTLSGERIFADMRSIGGVDGLAVDIYWNVIAACSEGIKMFSPEGSLLNTITVPEKTRNLVFGDEDGRILYITAGGSVYKVHLGSAMTYVPNILLGRPTDQSIVLNIRSERDLEIRFVFGSESSLYTDSTNIVSVKKNVPFKTVITNLLPNTKYFYRVLYHEPGFETFYSLDEYTFSTQKSSGSAFTFAVEADPHLDEQTVPEIYLQTLQNISDSSPDFLIDLGDNFMSDKLPVKSYDTIAGRNLLFRTYFDMICHSVPLYLVIGNHEAEQGWHLDGTPDNIAIWAALARKRYYPNPSPDSFYSGSDNLENYVGLRENYYAWTWGNSLFIVIDPYHYTKNKPGRNDNNWEWTLGLQQYSWFKQTLENSDAGFKFVFCHQIVGGNDTNGRGGAEAVPYYEMGGSNKDGSWGFDNERPGWDKPIHQLMVENGVSVYFHGHDHFFAKQVFDGIVYQLVPQPGHSNKDKTQAGEYGYINGEFIPGSGYLRVKVSEEKTTIAFIRTFLPEEETTERKNGESAYTYALYPSGTSSTSVISKNEIPVRYFLEQNYPNPFNMKTSIKYGISKESEVKIVVYNILGRKIRILINGVKPPGQYQAVWDGKNEMGKQVSSGIYLYKIMTENYSKTRKMLLLK